MSVGLSQPGTLSHSSESRPTRATRAYWVSRISLDVKGSSDPRSSTF